MLQVAAAEYDQALDRVESDLLELATRLDEPVADQVVSIALFSLGQRAWTLYCGFLSLIRSEVPAASLALMRPMIEINLTLRFIVADPELHTDIWIAEGERQLAILVREIEDDTELAAKNGALVMPDGWHEETAKVIEEVRERAVVAGVSGVSTKPGKQVMPSMHQIAVNHGDLASREAYTLAYRPLSPTIHTSSRAFDHSHFQRTPDGRWTFLELGDADGEIRRHRALAATTFASTLCLLSGPLDLNCLEEADLVKSVLLGITVAGAAEEVT